MKKCNCMCKFNEDVKASSTALWLFGICGFLMGVIVGFLCASSKKCGKKCCNKKSEGSCEKSLCDYDYDYDDDDDEIKF